MTFKRGFWSPVMLLLSAGNFAGMGFAVAASEPWHAAIHAALAAAFAWWGMRLRVAPPAPPREHPGANGLEDTRAVLAEQADQLAELNERVDFLERMLAQLRDRPALEKPEHP